MGNRDVLERDVKLGGALQEVGTNSSRDSFSLSDELGSIELSNYGLEDFITDGRKDTLIIVKPKGLRGKSVLLERGIKCVCREHKKGYGV